MPRPNRTPKAALAQTRIPDASDPRWQAVRRRDRAASGVFVYAVSTTGIYCRPGCASRQPRRENVELFATSTDAERAGYRACKRCQPERATLDDPHVATVARLCRILAEAETPPSLDELANHAGWSASHTQRTFRRVTGVTPARFAASLRSERVRAALGDGSTVTGAIFAAGYGSTSRFYEDSSKRLGMTPSQYRNRGAGADIRFATARCALGVVLGAATNRGVCAILLGDDDEQLRADLERRFPNANTCQHDSRFEATFARIVKLVEHPERAPRLPLDLHGTAFQVRVWEALRAVPAGTTTTYRELAEAIGAPRASRAVAGACAANPVAVAVPCHRVLRSDGDLSGYRWGVERKRALLDRERSH